MKYKFCFIALFIGICLGLDAECIINLNSENFVEKVDRSFGIFI